MVAAEGVNERKRNMPTNPPRPAIPKVLVNADLREHRVAINEVIKRLEALEKVVDKL
jgi:hypothetical protein